MRRAPSRITRAAFGGQAVVRMRLKQRRFALPREGVWLDGWIAFRTALRFDGPGMPEDVRVQLSRIIDRLKPVGLVERVHALVLERSQGGYSLEDGEEDDVDDVADGYRRIAEAAISIGEEATGSPEELKRLIDEISVSPHAPRAFEFGRGLARGAKKLDEMWTVLASAYFGADPATRNSRHVWRVPAGSVSARPRIRGCSSRPSD